MDATLTHDLAHLRDVYARPGPYASIYFDLRATGVQEALPRWGDVARELAHEGAGAGLLDVVRDRIFTSVPGPGPLALIAARAEVLLATELPGSAQPDLARYEVLPHFLPLLEWLQSRPAHIVAVVDRTGADITLHPGGTAEPVHWTVHGKDDEIERNAPGGWEGLTQGRYQRRAEDSWEHNAVQVVGELLPVIRKHAVKVLVLAGDVRALQFLEKHLPAEASEKVILRHVTGGRSEDGSERHREVQIAEALASAVAEQTDALLAQFDDERRPTGLAVDGAIATLDALAEGRVRTLLLAGQIDPLQPAWFGPSPTDVAADPETLHQRGVEPRRARLVDVAVHAALHTGADIRILPTPDRVPDNTAAATPAEGIGALCRFP